MRRFLVPRLSELQSEEVLVQAWKKTTRYIRDHNWYADTLAIDLASARLPEFLASVRERLAQPENWSAKPLRIVPAPKRQQWHLDHHSQQWAPLSPAEIPLRPLAHVSLEDQVAATSVMMCLADRVESRLGLSTSPTPWKADSVAYGNRLYCDRRRNSLHHRWGSTKLYRVFSVDYKAFLNRVDARAEAFTSGVRRPVIVHLDIRRFFDSVSTALLQTQIRNLQVDEEESTFFDLACALFKWQWHLDDLTLARALVDVSRRDPMEVALPQGLVASGFFSNVALMSFDEQMRALVAGRRPGGRLKYLDAIRYVDDIRVVVAAPQNVELTEIETEVAGQVMAMLQASAPGLAINPEKTYAVEAGISRRTHAKQSLRMARIQAAISGGFDVVGGEDVLDAIQGLLRAQSRYSDQKLDRPEWALAPIADVNDDAVARFAAARFRSTFRSLRPLLDTENPGTQSESELRLTRERLYRSQEQLDEEARLFALSLIERWITDPSNVRLLRIALDIWPSIEHLNAVAKLLIPALEAREWDQRAVIWYTIGELFRAAATETGFVEEEESLPGGVDIALYRERCAALACELLESEHAAPWYAQQQMLLLLLASQSTKRPHIAKPEAPELEPYLKLLSLRSDRSIDKERPKDVYEIVAIESFGGLEKDPANDGFSETTLDTASVRLRASRSGESIATEVEGGESAAEPSGELSLTEALQSSRWMNLLRTELGLLTFAYKFVRALQRARLSTGLPIDPASVTLANAEHIDLRFDVRIHRNEMSPSIAALYAPPSWEVPDRQWRFQLGYLLRAILVRSSDFSQTRRPLHQRRQYPYSPTTHWLSRKYSLYSGHEAFGEDWLPVSTWLETYLYHLLSWPGSLLGDPRAARESIVALRKAHRPLAIRLRKVKDRRMPGTRLQLVDVEYKGLWNSRGDRALRACVVQTALPDPKDFKITDLTCSGPDLRKRHRRHLSAAFAAVGRMLDLRDTHTDGGGIDWLILPELAVHPDDIQNLLVPFARAYRCMILAGLTYSVVDPGLPAVNSAIWVIPTVRNGRMKIEVRRQGKANLAALEEATYNSSGPRVRGWRPCQWLIGYQWSRANRDRPLWLSASICYDATDLALAAHLRDHSDVFAIPALNTDISTFDQMAMALHYHMFQLVIVANTGKFGGSNAYQPVHNTHDRQIFHMHGQPQSTMSFVEIKDIRGFIARTARLPHLVGKAADAADAVAWKFPPAGLRTKP